MQIYVTSVFVDDQEEALAFYSKKLGFQLKRDAAAGGGRWLTVTAQGNPKGPELLLEPSDHPAVGPFRKALMDDGIPAASFKVDDLDATFKRLSDDGVKFTQEPTDAGDVKIGVFNDTQGNLIQLVEMAEGNQSN